MFGSPGNLSRLCGVQEIKFEGGTVRRLNSLLSFVLLVALLSGCAPKFVALPEKVKALEHPTVTPEIVPHSPPASCPVTVPQDPPFTAPEPYSPNAPFQGEFWFGSKKLWTMLPEDGIWSDLPHNPTGYAQKVFWWREGYNWKEEPEPALSIVVERFGASTPRLISSHATNAYASDIGSAMLSGVGFPTLGCWKITGQYQDAELSFVVWVAP
jgi:hypothetical protein